MAVSKVLSGTARLSLLLVAPSSACPLPHSTLGVAHAALLGHRNPVSFFSMTDLQVFESSNPVSSGWALGQAKHSRSRERVLEEGAPSLSKFTPRCLLWTRGQVSGGRWQPAGIRTETCFRLLPASPLSSPMRVSLSRVPDKSGCPGS